jgi:RNA polymerase sigma-70 factor (ECF subfamily)
MAAVDAFGDLLLRVRQGDSDAACELVRRYESDIRIAVRTRLSDPALRRQFDSMDICQSVLASFFLRAAAGQYDLHAPGQLVALLTRMAHNKLAMHARGLYRQRRDIRRTSGEAGPANGIEVQPADAARAGGSRPRLDRRGVLIDGFRCAADRGLPPRGENWTEIARALGGTADSRRKQFTRAMDRIAKELDIE